MAWDRRLIFTIGTSSTTGESDTVVWNEIHHKTEFGSNLTGHGYPDPNYLDNVLTELSAQGVSEDNLKDWCQLVHGIASRHTPPLPHCLTGQHVPATLYFPRNETSCRSQEDRRGKKSSGQYLQGLLIHAISMLGVVVPESVGDIKTRWAFCLHLGVCRSGLFMIKSLQFIWEEIKLCRSIFVHAQVQNVCRIWVYLLDSEIVLIRDMFSTLALRNNANPTISLELGFITLMNLLNLTFTWLRGVVASQMSDVSCSVKWCLACLVVHVDSRGSAT